MNVHQLLKSQYLVSLKKEFGHVASVIRAWKKPEPYKGKGIKYSDEHIIRKEGKTAGKK